MAPLHVMIIETKSSCGGEIRHLVWNGLVSNFGQISMFEFQPEILQSDYVSWGRAIGGVWTCMKWWKRCYVGVEVQDLVPTEVDVLLMTYHLTSLLLLRTWAETFSRFLSMVLRIPWCLQESDYYLFYLPKVASKSTRSRLFMTWVWWCLFPKVLWTFRRYRWFRTYIADVIKLCRRFYFSKGGCVKVNRERVISFTTIWCECYRELQDYHGVTDGSKTYIVSVIRTVHPRLVEIATGKEDYC